MSTKVGRVFCVQPIYGSSFRLCAQQFDANMLRNDSPYGGRVYRALNGGSLLANTFNEAWVAALNYQLYGTTEQREITHFAMCHDDIAPDDGWLDVLMEELLKYDADVVSAVSPIKTLAGLSSTAIDDPEDSFSVERRLTMTEVHNLPETFNAADCGYEGRKLLINTGCWVCDFTKPWRLATHTVNGRECLRVRFHIDNEVRVVDTPEGKRYAARVASEDWNFCRDLLDVDPAAKIYATRKVKLAHYGTLPYGNQTAWGDDKIDPVYANRVKGAVPIGAPKGTPPETPTFQHATLNLNGSTPNGDGHQEPEATPAPAAGPPASASEVFVG